MMDVRAKSDVMGYPLLMVYLFIKQASIDWSMSVVAGDRKSVV